MNKYNLNDTVWTISNNKVGQFKIHGIIEEYDENLNYSKAFSIIYYLKDDKDYQRSSIHSIHYLGCKFEEKDLFPTKQDLINSL